MGRNCCACLPGAPQPAPGDDVWELYDGSTGWTQAHDLSKEMPEKHHELQRLWLIEATKYNVLPLDDRRVARFNPDLGGRPTLTKGNSQLLFWLPVESKLRDAQKCSQHRERHRTTTACSGLDWRAAADSDYYWSGRPIEAGKRLIGIAIEQCYDPARLAVGCDILLRRAGDGAALHDAPRLKPAVRRPS